MVWFGTLEATARRAEQEEGEGKQKERGEINVWKAPATVISTQILEAAPDSPQLQSCVGPVFTNTSLPIASAWYLWQLCPHLLQPHSILLPRVTSVQERNTGASYCIMEILRNRELNLNGLVMLCALKFSTENAWIINPMKMGFIVEDRIVDDTVKMR